MPIDNAHKIPMNVFDFIHDTPLFWRSETIQRIEKMKKKSNMEFGSFQ